MAEDQTNEKNEQFAKDEAEAKAYFSQNLQFLDPPLRRAAYSDRMAWIMASMAELAYDKFEFDVKDRMLFPLRLDSGGFRLVATFNSKKIDPKTDTQAFLAECDTFAVLAFRGTEVAKVIDIKTDAQFGKVFTINGKVHEGFAGAYGIIEPDIKREIRKLKPDLPLYITGHSLGAALATVCTQSLEHDGDLQKRIAACYTFGSPRVGDVKFDKGLKSPIYRVINTTDIVTTVPLRLMGFEHVGDERFLERAEGGLRRYTPIWRVFLFLFTVFSLFGPLVGDHSISEYRHKLGEVVEKRNLSLAEKVVRHTQRENRG